MNNINIVKLIIFKHIIKHTRKQAIKYSDLMNANHQVVKDNISRTHLYQLNRNIYSELCALKYERVDLLLRLRNI